MPKIPRKKTNKTYSQYDPKIHVKTKGGHGFGMKKGIKSNNWENSGLHLVDVFKWSVPKHLEKAYEEFKKANA